jgi:hypothetical protein
MIELGPPSWADWQAGRWRREEHLVPLIARCLGARRIYPTFLRRAARLVEVAAGRIPSCNPERI